MSKNKILVIVIVIISAIILIIELFFSNNYDEISNEDVGIVETQDSVSQNKDNSSDSALNNNEELDNGEETGEDSAKKGINNKIYVYVTGEVNNSGVVILDEGARISDAIDSAGGTTEKADLSKINLVFVLEDGMKVNIPNKDDLNSDKEFDYIVVGSGDNSTGIVNDSNKSNSKSTSSSSNTSNIVNINHASQTELETLPGIGPSLALKIINYRNENGSFSAIDDIKNVSGIRRK